MEECPVCLEPLEGTIVNLGCCKNKLHIQCYVNKCPFCRAELPSPHVVVPVPVPVVQRQQLTNFQKILPTLAVTAGLTIYVCLMFFTR